jgi:protein phosphatase
VLADGMGGYNAGEVASGMATSFIKTELGRWLQEAVGNGVGHRRAARDGHLRRQRQPRHLQRRQLEPAVRRHGHDARRRRVPRRPAADGPCRRLARLPAACRAAAQITHDHSLLQEQIDAGLITAEQAAFSANKNLVTRAVGVEDTVLLETHLHDLMPGDVYLLCSDGLSDMLDDETISQMLQSTDSLRRGGNGPDRCGQ